MMANAGPPQWGISVGVLENQPQPQDEALRMLVMQEECGGRHVWGRGRDGGVGSTGLALPSGMLSGVGATKLPQRADFYPLPSSRDLKLHLPSAGSRLAPASSPLFMEQRSRCQTWGLGGTGALPVKPVSPVQCHPAPPACSLPRHPRALPLHPRLWFGGC